MSNLIGLGHYSRVGKDTLAGFLKEAAIDQNKKVEALSFAESLKKNCHELYSWAGVKPAEYYETEEGAKERDTILPDLKMSVVELWIKYGMLVREIHPDTFINCTVFKASDPNVVYVIKDVRFPNEFNVMYQKGGVMVKLERDGIGPRPNSPADNALNHEKRWHYTFKGTMRELQEFAFQLLLKLKKKH